MIVLNKDFINNVVLDRKISVPVYLIFFKVMVLISPLNIEVIYHIFHYEILELYQRFNFLCSSFIFISVSI